MKPIATLETYDRNDCTQKGYSFALYPDGHLSADYRSCWQGSRSGQRYITGPSHVDMSKLDNSNPDSDAEALLTSAVQFAEPSNGREWRQVRRGYIVR